MNKYQHILAKGATLKELSEDMNRVANIRDVEIAEAVKQGYDVVTTAEEYFKPVGELSFVNGEYVQVMRRRI